MEQVKEIQNESAQQVIAQTIIAGKEKLAQLAEQAINLSAGDIEQLSDDEKRFLAASPSEKQVAYNLMEVMAKNIANTHAPEIMADGSIEMALTKGGRVRLAPAGGRHIMEAARLQSTFSEKARNETEDMYVMVACADITDDKEEFLPMAVTDIEDRLTARDLRVLLDAFRNINLL